MERTPSVPSSRVQQFLGTQPCHLTAKKKIARILADVSVTFHVEQERSVVDSAGIFTLRGDDGPVPLRGESLHLVAPSNFQEIRKYLGPYSLYPCSRHVHRSCVRFISPKVTLTALVFFFFLEDTQARSLRSGMMLISRALERPSSKFGLFSSSC